MDILKLNAISPLAAEIMQGYDLVDESVAPVGILVRSANMAEYDLPSSVLAVARAGAGVNNIPHADYAKRGVVVFNTPGANANAVKEMVICEFMLAARNLVEGVKWTSTLEGDDVAKQVEKGKKKFVGHEIAGKTLCVLGLGAIGRKVASAAYALGMTVKGYDPYLSDAAKAEIPFVEVLPTAEQAYAGANFVSLHMPATDETKGMINAAAIAGMADGAVVVNAARGELVVVSDIKAALASGKLHKYVCDFPTEEINTCDGIIRLHRERQHRQLRQSPLPEGGAQSQTPRGGARKGRHLARHGRRVLHREGLHLHPHRHGRSHRRRRPRKQGRRHQSPRHQVTPRPSRAHTIQLKTPLKRTKARHKASLLSFVALSPL